MSLDVETRAIRAAFYEDVMRARRDGRLVTSSDWPSEDAEIQARYRRLSREGSKP